jgi:hypothetical protein
MKDFSIMVVAAVVVVPFAFLVYLASGGFLAVVWCGIGSVALQDPCPLTWLEHWAPAHAGIGQCRLIDSVSARTYTRNYVR